MQHFAVCWKKCTIKLEFYVHAPVALPEAPSSMPTEPMEPAVPLMTPFRPLVKKPPMPLWLPSTTMLMT